MSGFSFDSNILIDALNGNSAAHAAIETAEARWISRLTWIEVLSKERGGTAVTIGRFLDGFAIDELTFDISVRAAALRRERGRLKLADSVILASAQAHSRILITRNIRDFPPGTPGIRIPYLL